MKKEKTKFNNIYKYQTKKGTTKYRVIIMVDYKTVDKSGFATINEARAFITNIQNYIQEEHNKPKRYTFQEYFELYKENKIKSGQWNLTTLHNQTLYYERIGKPFDKFYLDEITKLQLQQYFNKLADKGMKSNTLYSYKKFFCAIFNDAIKNEILTVNRAKYIDIPVTDKLNKQLEKEQYYNALDYVQKHENIQVKTFYLLCSLGMRKSEALAVCENTITFLENGTVKINIDRTITPEYLSGKNSTKTNVDRLIYGDKTLYDTLKLCIESTKKILITHNKPYTEDTPLIVSKQAKTYHPNAINIVFQRISKNVGFTITPHMLRHYFATQAHLAGISPRLIADFLGHSEITMTDKYSHPTDEGAKQVLSQIVNKIR